jgi:hypothetical protein
MIFIFFVINPFMFFRWIILLCLFSGSWCLLIMGLLQEWVCKPFYPLPFYVIIIVAYFINIFGWFSLLLLCVSKISKMIITCTLYLRFLYFLPTMITSSYRKLISLIESICMPLVLYAIVLAWAKFAEAV